MAPPGENGVTAAVLRVENLGFAYPAGQPVFPDWSADIGPGVTWIIGDESTGKTTLLKLLAGELTGSGRIAVDGPVALCDPRDDRNDPLGVGDFFDGLRRAHPAFDEPALARHIAGFGLEPHLGKAFFQLSTGSRRKVGLAGVLAAGAPLTLLDDPTAALDAASVAHLMRTLVDAAGDPSRAWIVTAYHVPNAWTDARVIRLPDRV